MNTATAAKPKAQAKAQAKAPPAPAAEPKAAVIQEPAEPPRKIEQLGPARLTAAEFMRNVHVADAAPNTRPQDLEDPTFWAHVAAKMKPRDRIEVWVDDNSWFAECVVLGCTKTDAVVKVLGVWDLNGHQIVSDRADSNLKAYRVEFRGHFEKWGVIRKVDNEVVHTGEATEGGAWSWLKERLKAGV